MRLEAIDRARRNEMTNRPTLGTAEQIERATGGVAEVVAELQRGLDEGNAEIYNAGFAADVVWGGPFGATVNGYDALHGIHGRLLSQSTAGASRYEVVSVSAPAPDIAVAQVRRTPLDPADDFAEMALYVLVRRGERWWLAAGQNTPVRPGRSATESD